MNEFSSELKERTVLNRSIVFYRDETGVPVALQNRCLHRSFPLHESRLERGGIRCGYHGIKYDHDGKMIEIPCQDSCPDKRLHKYPLCEIGPYTWIWMGDPDAADEKQIPELRKVHDNKEWTLVVGERYHIEGNYLLMVENLCDLTHIPYLHGQTFQFPEEYAQVPIEVERDGNQVEFYRRIEDWNLVRTLFHPSVDFSGRPIRYKSGGRFVSPGFFNGFGIVTPLDEGDEAKDTGNYINHYLTPETQNTCHYHWYVARNYLLDDPVFDSNLRKLITRGFNEDKFATNVMQRMLEGDQHEFSEMVIAADQPGILMRMAVRNMVDDELAITAGGV